MSHIRDFTIYIATLNGKQSKHAFKSACEPNNFTGSLSYLNDLIFILYRVVSFATAHGFLVLFDITTITRTLHICLFNFLDK